MKTLLIAAAVAASLHQAAQEQPSPPTAAQFRAARTALNERLLDYPSARFRDVRGNAFVICGFVNAKNRMGAYTGWSRFAYVGGDDEPRLLMEDSEGRDDILLDAFCGDDGRRQTGTDYTDRVTHR